jgi:hypothetical protein
VGRQAEVLLGTHLPFCYLQNGVIKVAGNEAMRVTDQLMEEFECGISERCSNRFAVK